MRIENTRFGTIDIDEEKIIDMPASMLGFPGRNRYILLERQESKPFLWYQCVDDPSLAFAVLNPNLCKPDYSIDIHSVMEEMSWEADEEEALFVCVVVNAASGAPENITANLMAPVIINTKKFEALQKVFHDSPFSHKHPVFEKE